MVTMIVLVQSLALATAHRRQAEIWEQLGDTARAARHYAAFIDLWREADPPLQLMVLEARGRLAALSPSRSSQDTLTVALSIGAASDLIAYSDLAATRSLLSWYYKRVGEYPRTTDHDLRGRWRQLSQHLVDQLAHEGLEFKDIPGEQTPEHLSYDYQASPDGKDYVLAVPMLSRYAHEAILTNDLDGVVYGINCDDPVYCIGPAQN